MICSHLGNRTPSPSLKVCWDLSNVFQDMSHQQRGKQEVYRHNNQGPTTANSRKTDEQLRSMTWNIQYKPIGSVFLADRMVWVPMILFVSTCPVKASPNRNLQVKASRELHFSHHEATRCETNVFDVDFFPGLLWWVFEPLSLSPCTWHETSRETQRSLWACQALQSCS